MFTDLNYQVIQHNPQRADDRSVDVVALETELAKIQWTQVESRDAVKTYNKYPVSKVIAEMPGFDWAAWAKPQGIDMAARTAEVSRKTKETEISVSLDVDGAGKADIATGVGFFDHMLTLLAKHGLFDLTVRAAGDLQDRLRETFVAARVGAEQALIGVQHADERDARKIVAFRQHLGAHENLHVAGCHGMQQRVERPLAARAVAVEARDARPWKQRAELLVDALCAGADGDPLAAARAAAPLERALGANGTTVRDYRTGTGERGRFQFELKVYGRGGEPCRRCGRRLVTTHAIDGRHTTLCPFCQR